MIIAYKEDMPQVKIELRGRNGEIEYDAYLSTGTFKCLIPEGEKGFALLLEMWCEVERRDRFCSVCGASVTKVVTQEFLVSADNLIEKLTSYFMKET